MNKLQKIVGKLFPPYRFKIERQELTILVDSLISSLSEDFDDLKEQRKKTKLFNLNDWDLFPGFKFVTILYPGTTLNDFKKHGDNYKISGLRIYSKRQRDYKKAFFLIRDSCLVGIRIEDSSYQMEEYDLLKIETESIQKEAVYFPPSEIELFYDKLDDVLKSQLNLDDVFEIDVNNRTYYAFYDMENGNYLAVDKKLNVYSLVHDAQPVSKKINYTMNNILSDIKTKTFDIDKHLEGRYKK